MSDHGNNGTRRLPGGYILWLDGFCKDRKHIIVFTSSSKTLSCPVGRLLVLSYRETEKAEALSLDRWLQSMLNRIAVVAIYYFVAFDWGGLFSCSDI